jgi:hypothetical protein
MLEHCLGEKHIYGIDEFRLAKKVVLHNPGGSGSSIFPDLSRRSTRMR